MLKMKFLHFGHLMRTPDPLGKVPDAVKDSGQLEKTVSEDKMAGWNHQCNGHELGQIWGDGEGQGGLVCCNPWGCKNSDMTGRLNTSKYIYKSRKIPLILVV